MFAFNQITAVKTVKAVANNIVTKREGFLDDDWGL